jgi:hypothetical protein
LGVSYWQWTVCDTRFHVGRARALFLINSRVRLHNPRSLPGLAVKSGSVGVSGSRMISSYDQRLTRTTCLQWQLWFRLHGC